MYVLESVWKMNGGGGAVARVSVPPPPPPPIPITRKRSSGFIGRCQRLPSPGHYEGGGGGAQGTDVLRSHDERSVCRSRAMVGLRLLRRPTVIILMFYVLHFFLNY